MTPLPTGTSFGAANRSTISLLVLCLMSLVLPSVPTAEGQVPGSQSAEVTQVLDAWVKALNSNDLTLLLDQIAPDAKIDSRAAGGRVSKDKFATAIKALLE